MVIRRRHVVPRTAALIAASVSPLAHAEGFSGLDEPLAIVWVTVAAALVFLMQAGFALLESGMARAKNAINVIMKNFSDVSAGVLAFWLVGFGLMFGANHSGWIGRDLFAPSDVSSGDAVFVLYQAMFAATAATIVSGAVAERIRYGPYLLISVFITALIYPVSGSWIWGGVTGGEGWLAALGFHDFAGATVVHSVGGWCALAGIMVLGPRRGRFSREGDVRDVPGHNLSFVALGVFILWFGWFGFNGGSILGDTAALGNVVLNTQLGAVSGVVGALLWMALSRRPILMTLTVNGALGGLVAVTAGADVLTPPFAIVAGLIGGSITVVGWNIMARLGLDDVVGAVPVHGFCGAWGTVAVVLLDFDGGVQLDAIAVQLLGIVAVFVWAFAAAWLVFQFFAATLGIRASSMHEQRGLDFTEHYEIAYPEFQQTVTQDPRATRS